MLFRALEMLRIICTCGFIVNIANEKLILALFWQNLSELIIDFEQSYKKCEYFYF